MRRTVVVERRTNAVLLEATTGTAPTVTAP